jgi:hypothetical protein
LAIALFYTTKFNYKPAFSNRFLYSKNVHKPPSKTKKGCPFLDSLFFCAQTLFIISIHPALVPQGTPPVALPRFQSASSFFYLPFAFPTAYAYDLYRHHNIWP